MYEGVRNPSTRGVTTSDATANPEAATVELYFVIHRYPFGMKLNHLRMTSVGISTKFKCLCYNISDILFAAAAENHVDRETTSHLG